MMFEVPKLSPGTGKFPLLSFDIVGKDGSLIRKRPPVPSEIFKYLAKDGVVDAFNERADFDLWKGKQDLAAISEMRGWAPYRPGYWRGQFNPNHVSTPF